MVVLGVAEIEDEHGALFIPLTLPVAKADWAANLTPAGKWGSLNFFFSFPLFCPGVNFCSRFFALKCTSGTTCLFTLRNYIKITILGA